MCFVRVDQALRARRRSCGELSPFERLSSAWFFSPSPPPPPRRRRLTRRRRIRTRPPRPRRRTRYRRSRPGRPASVPPTRPRRPSGGVTRPGRRGRRPRTPRRSALLEVLARGARAHAARSVVIERRVAAEGHDALAEGGEAQDLVVVRGGESLGGRRPGFIRVFLSLRRRRGAGADDDAAVGARPRGAVASLREERLSCSRARVPIVRSGRRVAFASPSSAPERA